MALPRRLLRQPSRLGLSHHILDGGGTEVGGDANVGMLFVCDGRINDYDFILLEDDQNFFLIYNGTPMVRDDLLEEAPDVADILNEVAALITDDEMRELCHSVDVDGAEPSEAAYDWCVENELIEAEE